MKPQNIQNPTRRIGAPRNWDHSKEGICHTLEVVDRDGWMISAWQPNDKELAILNSGGFIYLMISGSPQTQHPVVSMQVDDK